MAGEASNSNGENLLLAGASDPDAWDDSALIAAYDEAVARARELALGDGRHERSGGGRQRRQQQQQQQQQKKQPLKQQKHQHQQQQQQQQQQQDEGRRRQWRAGDLCRAVWSEDGVEYRARIVRLTDAGRCLLEFVDYGNSEEQALADLLPPLADDADVGGAAGFGRSADTEWASASCQPHPPPPPPLPAMPDAASAAMDESTYNMLMSWYMSGYYTGYYVGRKSAQ